MTWRTDPRLGLFKSALQKGIRRSDLELTARAATELVRFPGGEGALSRRLLVITAEDVGSRWLPATDTTIQAAVGPTDLINAAVGLASVPERNKEAYWLACQCWDGRRVPTVVDRAALALALQAGDHREVLAVALAGRDRRQWRSGERLVDGIIQAAKDGPPATQHLVEVALDSERQVDSGATELIAAAVIAAIDRPEELPSALDVNRTTAFEPTDPLPWFAACDGHTDPGRRALRRVALAHGLPTQLLTELAFAFEASKVVPDEPTVRWRDEARRLDATAYGWQTPEAGEQMWGDLRDEVRLEVELELVTWR